MVKTVENNKEATHPFGSGILKYFQSYIRILLLGADISFVCFSWWLSSRLILGPFSLTLFAYFATYTLPLLILVRLIVFNFFGLYRAILRYASFHFAVNVIKAVLISSIIVHSVIYLTYNDKLPGSLFVCDTLFTMLFIGFTRFFPRYYAEWVMHTQTGEKRVLIYGAGEVGDTVARSLLRQKEEFLPIGFIDDDQLKCGRKVHNLPILGTRKDLDKVFKKYRINEMIVAINNFPAEELRILLKFCRSHHAVCRLVPHMPGTENKEVSIKNIDIADLLKRNPQDLDEKQIDRFIKDKTILVTGAAGSIGSELVNQSIRFKAKRLILVDHSEFGLYRLEETLRALVPDNKEFVQKFNFVLQDLCDFEPLDHLVKTEKPDLIFHAAAYKHVPMIEMNPSIGVINNVKGTINMANIADKHGVEKFLMISTDKAVRPTNVMGATKRVCELYIQNLNLRSKTEYVAVRFGNVLGSSGSVIPKFLRQINTGGPITVTHPEVVRYFMLIEEAVELVMQAASIGHGGEIFILNMGKPVKIKDMAEDLIFLAGKEPYKDIDIQFTGMRPGEKLYEELLIDETEKKTQYENITIAKMTFVDWAQLNLHINRLLVATGQYNREQLLLCIKTLVPEFIHVDLPAESATSHNEQDQNVISIPLNRA